MLDATPAAAASARPAHTLAPAPPPVPATPSGTPALFVAATALLPVLAAGRPLDAATLRDAMTRAHGASDAQGAWVWKDAYEAAEAAVVLFLKRYGCVFRSKPITHSSPNRSLIPFQADHPFRSMPITDSSPMPITFRPVTGTVGGA